MVASSDPLCHSSSDPCTLEAGLSGHRLTDYIVCICADAVVYCECVDQLDGESTTANPVVHRHDHRLSPKNTDPSSLLFIVELIHRLPNRRDYNRAIRSLLFDFAIAPRRHRNATPSNAFQPAIQRKKDFLSNFPRNENFKGAFPSG